MSRQPQPDGLEEAATRKKVEDGGWGDQRWMLEDVGMLELVLVGGVVEGNPSVAAGERGEELGSMVLWISEYGAVGSGKQWMSERQMPAHLTHRVTVARNHVLMK